MIASVGDAVALDEEGVDTTLEDFEVLDTIVDVLADELLTLVVVLVDELLTLVVEEATLLLLDEAREVRRYSSRRFPAPQYS